MIKWHSLGEKMTGFTYYPLLEISVGIFLLICSFVVPILFLVYNGINRAQWDELLFCALFFLLFSFMGKSLTFQSLNVTAEGEQLRFYQNLREPPTEFQISKYELEGLNTREEVIGDDTFYILNVRIPKENEFYRSVNRKEIAKISEAIIALGKQTKEDN
jgi:hypothetical protein